MRSIALDLGVKSVSYCEVRDGRVIERRTVGRVLDLGPQLGIGTPKARVAVEASREAWFVVDLLREWGHEPLLVDTTRVRQLGIGAHGRKTDRIDAEVLARAVESNTIPKAHILSFDGQRVRAQLCTRQTLVAARADFVVQARGLARAAGIRIPRCETERFVEVVAEMAMPASLRASLAPMLAVLPVLNEQILVLDQKLHELCSRHPKMALLMTAPGVALVVAAAFISVVDDAHRFKSAHHLASYLGLVPSEDSSGTRRRIGSITKKGNSYARAMIVEASWALVKSKDTRDPIVAWARELAKKKKPKLVIAVAVARRLTGVLWAMWKRDAAYDPRWEERAAAAARATPPMDPTTRAQAIARAVKKIRPKSRSKEVDATPPMH